MSISNTGNITFADIQAEFGGVSPIQLSEYYRGGAFVIDGPSMLNSIPQSGIIKVSGLRGTEKVIPGSFSYLGYGNHTYSGFEPDPYRYIIAVHAWMDAGNIVDPFPPSINGEQMTVIEAADVRYRDDSHSYGFFYTAVPNANSVTVTNTHPYPNSFHYFTITGIEDFSDNYTVAGSVSSLPGTSAPVSLHIANTYGGTMVGVHITNFDENPSISIIGSSIVTFETSEASLVGYDSEVSSNNETYTFGWNSSISDYSIVRKMLFWNYDW